MSISDVSAEQPDYPWDASLRARVEAILSLASRAPSAHNTQPWAVSWHSDTLRVRRDARHTLTHGDPTTRQATLSVGMFTETFLIAAHRRGLATELDVIATWPAALDLVDIHLADGAEERVDPMYTAIVARRTNRGPYSPHIEPELVEALATVPSEPGVNIFAVTDTHTKELVGRLVGEGMALALRMPSLRREMADLVHWHDDPAPRGMAVEALLGPTRAGKRGESAAGEWFLGNVDADTEAAHLRDAYASAPLLLVVATDADDPAAWLQAGRVACRILLQATAHGLAHCISAAPVEIPTLTPQLRTAVTHPLRPQFLVRVGYPHDPGYTVPSFRARQSLRPTGSGSATPG